MQDGQHLKPENGPMSNDLATSQSAGMHATMGEARAGSLIQVQCSSLIGDELVCVSTDQGSLPDAVTNIIDLSKLAQSFPVASEYMTANDISVEMAKYRLHWIVLLQYPYELLHAPQGRAR